MVNYKILIAKLDFINVNHLLYYIIMRGKSPYEKRGKSQRSRVFFLKNIN